MIRFINCVRRRPDIPPETFRQYWQDDQFSMLVAQVAGFTKAKRFAKNLTLVVEANVWVMEQRGSGPAYDGTIEYWWDDARGFASLMQTPEARTLLRQMMDYQEQFIDFAGSSAFFTEA
jgi:hypothetical protein